MARGSPKEPKTDYGQRLRDAREHAQLTQAELAKAAGLTQATIGELERKGLGSRHTAKLADACKVRAEWLARGDAPMLAQTLSQEMVEIVLPLDQLTGNDRVTALDMLRNLRSLIRAPSPVALQKPQQPPRPQTVLLSSTKARRTNKGERRAG